VLRVAIGQLRHRLGRTLALLLGIAVAATSFSVLTGAVETTRVEVRGTVTGSFRSTYDLLVRPGSSYTEVWPPGRTWADVAGSVEGAAAPRRRNRSRAAPDPGGSVPFVTGFVRGG
jgi:hypothetical protein